MEKSTAAHVNSRQETSTPTEAKLMVRLLQIFLTPSFSKYLKLESRQRDRFFWVRTVLILRIWFHLHRSCIGHDPAVMNLYHTLMEVLDQRVLMRHHEDGGPPPVDLAEQVDNFKRERRVDIPG